MTLKATRRLSESCGDVAFGEPGEGRRERDQRPHQAQRRAEPDQGAGALEPPHRAEVEVGERLGRLLVAVGAAVLGDEPADRLGHLRAGRDPLQRGGGGGRRRRGCASASSACSVASCRTA